MYSIINNIHAFSRHKRFVPINPFELNQHQHLCIIIMQILALLRQLINRRHHVQTIIIIVHAEYTCQYLNELAKGIANRKRKYKHILRT